MSFYLNKICVTYQQGNENLITHNYNYKIKWQGIPRFRTELIHELTQRSPKQQSPLLFYIVHKTDLIMCYDKMFETVRTHNINKKREKQIKITKGFPIIDRISP